MITIQKEPFSMELGEEILPLAQKCWDESTLAKGETCAYYGERDFKVEPEFNEYLRLASNGAVLIVTLRDNDVLQGYVVGVLYHSLHHKRISCALGDSIYIEPPFRSYTAVLAERFEKELKALGVEIIGWPTHVNGPVYPVLKSRGYVSDDVVMEKRLCV